MWSVLTCNFFYDFLANLASTPQENKDGKEQYSYIRGFGFDEDGKKDTNYRKFCKYHYCQHNSKYKKQSLCNM